MTNGPFCALYSYRTLGRVIDILPVCQVTKHPASMSRTAKSDLFTACHLVHLPENLHNLWSLPAAPILLSASA